MSPQRIEFTVYFVGILLLGTGYYLIKGAVSDAAFIIGVVVYLLALRVLGRYLAKRYAPNAAGGGSDV